MKCLVTGGAGFIASHLVDRLIALGHSVVILDNLSTGIKKNVNKKAKFVKCDIKDFKKIKPYFKNINYVFHLAANAKLQESIEQPLETHATNVTGTLNVLEAARLNKIKKLVFISSAAVYGMQEKMPISENATCAPVSPYGLHKIIGEEYAGIYAKLFNLPVVTVRFFNVYGSRSRDTGAYPLVIPAFIKQKKQGIPLTIIGDGLQTRDYVHVSDVVNAVILAAESRIKDATPINVGSGRETSVNEIAKIIGGAKKHLPARIGEMKRAKADIKRAKQLLNWEPKVDLKSGIAQLI